MVQMKQWKKRLFGGIVSLVMLCTPVMAAEPVPESINFDQAVVLAEKANTSLSSLAKKAEYLNDNKGDLVQLHYGDTGSGAGTFIDSDRLSYLNAVTAMDNTIEGTKLQQEITKKGMRATIKSYFATIQVAEGNLALLDRTIEVQKTLRAQGRIKAELGFLSQKDLEKLERDTELTIQSHALLDLEIENAYMQLNDLLGLPAEARYKIDNEVVYAPLDLQMPLSDYINSKLSQDESLKIQKLAVDTAEFNSKVISSQSTMSSLREDEYAYDEAQRAHRDAKEDKEQQMKTAYNNILKQEENRKTLIENLEQAKADQETAQINLSVGRTTQIVLSQAELGVAQAEQKLLEHTLTHDVQAYTLQYPVLLGGGQ